MSGIIIIPSEVLIDLMGADPTGEMVATLMGGGGARHSRPLPPPPISYGQPMSIGYDHMLPPAQPPNQLMLPPAAHTVAASTAIDVPTETEHPMMSGRQRRSTVRFDPWIVLGVVFTLVLLSGVTIVGWVLSQPVNVQIEEITPNEGNSEDESGG